VGARYIESASVTTDRIPYVTENKMSKSQDAKKSTKKEPAKTAKEKKADKKVKKEEKKRQQ
jgi:hypothetical protein